MKTLIQSLLICGALVVLSLRLGNNMVQAQRGSEPTPAPRPTLSPLPPRLVPAPGTRIPVGENIYMTADRKGIVYFVDQSGNPVSVISKDMKPPPGNTKPVILLPQPYQGSVEGTGVRTTAASSAHSLDIPWGSFIRGFVLLPRDLNSPAGNTAASISWFTHAGFHWDASYVFDSTSQGVNVRLNTDWNRFELLDVQAYWDHNLGKAAAEWGEGIDTGKPYNFNYCNKITYDQFYCSQLVWREYFDYGVDLDSNYTQLAFCNPQNAVVSPDDLYYSPQIAINWDSRWSMSCTNSSYPWRGEYYSNTSLSGSAYIFCDSSQNGIDFDWGLGAPSGSLPSDNFSVRWTRTMYFPAGRYRFHLAGDDGYRLWVDGNLLIDEWHDQSWTEKTAERTLSSGNHTIKTEYYEHTWNASVKLWWEGAYRVFLPAIFNSSTRYLFPPLTSSPTPPLKMLPTPTRAAYP